MEFDYVIVGGGSAGCVLANRLSEDAAVTVCLLEAGPQDSNPLIRIPFATLWMMRSAALNWNYRTAPEPALHGRRLFWPRPLSTPIAAANLFRARNFKMKMKFALSFESMRKRFITRRGPAAWELMRLPSWTPNCAYVASKAYALSMPRLCRH